jgi:signal transduction histidine kinase
MSRHTGYQPPLDVPGVRAGEPSVDVQRTARIAGLKGFETPTLEQIERRRFELLGITFFLLIVFSIGMVVTSFISVSPEWLRFFGGSANAIRASLVLLAIGFAAYVMDKERNLRKLSKVVINERVLSAALSNRLKEISLLTEAGKAVISTLELEDVLGVILNAAFELLEADEGSVLLVEADELVVAAAVGHPRLYVGDRHKMTEGLSGYVARNREPLLIVGRPQSVDFAQLIPDKPPIASAMSVPLEAKGELLGVLNLNVIGGPRRYNEYDLRAASLFAEHAAMAIRHARVLRREREMRLHIAELDRIRAELVASMAHDLKTPLTTILGVSRALLQREADIDPGKRREFLVAVEGQAQRLLSLIERLLEAARSQARHLPLDPAPLDLVPMAEALARNYASAHGRRISVDSAPRVQAFADHDAVEQVLANLVENAIKYTPEEGEVHIRLRPVDGDVEVTVSDQGPGIAEEDLPYLFMPFRRGQTGGTGVGLGLFIVSNLVKAMGGTIRASSTPGEGTAFTFTLPVEAWERSATGSEGMQ